MKSRNSQRGLTLIVVLIFLVMLTLFSVSAFKASTSNARATASLELRQEATAAAQAALEDAISTSNFALPAATAASSSITVGRSTYSVMVTPAIKCTKIRQLPVSELPKDPTTGLPTTPWKRCDSGEAGRPTGGASTGSFVEGGTNITSGKSFCAETVWTLQADVNDAKTNTNVQVTQDVAVPYSLGESRDKCMRIS
jgi:Tfp pilus assembly protein PilX